MEELKQRLKDVGAKVRGWQLERRLSDAELLRRYRGLGTDRTFGRIICGDLDELDVARWVNDYEAVWQCIQMDSEESTIEEPLYDDLYGVIELRRAVAEAMREQGTSRLVLVQGPTGCGKTTAARMLRARYGARVQICEADETWKESPPAMLGGILAVFGVDNPPPSAAQRLMKLIKILKETRTCLVIDEAHHLGPRTLNLIKTIINQTPGEVVMLAMATLWKKLERESYEEARQLTQNRLCERIRLDTVEVADVEKIVKRRLGETLPASIVQKAAESICDAVRQKGGGLSLVKLICRKARKLSGKDKSVGLEDVGKAIALVVASR